MIHETKRLCSREAVNPSTESEALKSFASQLFESRFGPGSAGDAAAVSDAALKRAKLTASRLAEGEVTAPLPYCLAYLWGHVAFV